MTERALHFSSRATILLLLLCFWQDKAGSQNTADKVRQEVLHWGESTRQMYGPTEADLGSLHWDASILDPCTQDAYRRMTSLVQNPASNHCPTHYYRLSHNRGGTLCLTADCPQAAKESATPASRQNPHTTPPASTNSAEKPCAAHRFTAHILKTNKRWHDKEFATS